jgi:CRP-like cAMP-binding protein
MVNELFQLLNVKEIMMINDQQKALLSIIESYNQLSEISFELFWADSSIKHFPKESYVIKEDVYDESEYFLLDGLLQKCNYTKDRDSITTGFYLPGTVITPNFARTIGGKSTFTIHALVECTIAIIPVSVLDKLRSKYEDIRIFGKRVVERELTKSVNQEIAFRAHSAKERLLSLRNEYPNLENLVPHTIIASYLGITPVSFSRLRNDLAQTK